MELKSMDIMAAIMAEKDLEMQAQQHIPLDEEGQAIASEKRKTFDLPTNAVKVDPLR